MMSTRNLAAAAAPSRTRRSARPGLPRATGAAPVLGKPLARVNVIVVEDDRPSAKLLALLLREAGARVDIAYDAEEALALLEDARPHVMIVDLVLPRMSGLLLVEQIRSKAWGASLPMIAVTAINGPEAERVVKQAGCAGYIRKPVDVDTFAETVARMFRGEA